MGDFAATFRRRLCFAVDIQGYGAHTVAWQVEAQRVLTRAVDEAAHQCGLRPDAWWRQPSGDGEVVVIDDGGSEPVLVGRFPTVLSDVLRSISGRGEPRVRLAVHHGVTHRAAAGFAGAALVEVVRIVDARPVKDALDAAPGANLVFALSEQTFLDAVRSGCAGLYAADFRAVQVRNKEYNGGVRVAVPGVERVEHGADDAPAERADQDGVRSVHQSATGDVVVQAGKNVRIGSMTNVTGDLHAPLRGYRRG